MASVGGWSEGQQGLNPIALSTFRTRTRPVGTQKKKESKEEKSSLAWKIPHFSLLFLILFFRDLKKEKNCEARLSGLLVSHESMTK
jgi:hypothetical protein